MTTSMTTGITTTDTHGPGGAGDGGSGNLTPQGAPGGHKRSPRAATYLAFFLAGLGQVYCGRLARGLLLYVLNMFTAALGALGFFFDGPAFWYLFGGASALSTIIWIYGILDARRLARRSPSDYVLKDYNRWYVYLLLFVLQIPIGVGFSMQVRANIMQAFRMATDCMAPNIRQGERVLVDKRAYASGPVHRGDIVALTNPNNRSQKNIKRVIGLPGDTVALKNGDLLVNGIKLRDNDGGGQIEGLAGQVMWERLGHGRHRVVVPDSEKDPNKPTMNFPQIKVPNGQVFVMNDNRADTYDSRDYGTVPLADIIGRVIYVYWPRRADVDD